MKDFPNKRTMVINALGQYDSESDNEETEATLVLDNELSDQDDIGFEQGENLICKRVLSAQVALVEDNQR